MSILKALQKKQTEQVIEHNGNRTVTGRNGHSPAVVVQFDKNSRRTNNPPELLSNSRSEDRNTGFGVQWAVGFYDRDGTP